MVVTRSVALFRWQISFNPTEEQDLVSMDPTQRNHVHILPSYFFYSPLANLVIVESYDRELGDENPTETEKHRAYQSHVNTDGVMLRNYVPSRPLAPEKWYALFIICHTMITLSRRYESPTLPTDYVPVHRFDDTLYTGIPNSSREVC